VSLSSSEVLRLLITLSAVLAVAHSVGFIFVRLRQPRVAGEIIGGLLLGPTVLGVISPHLAHQIVAGSASTTAVLAAVYQFGQFLLMFCAGAAIRSGRRHREARTTTLVALIGNVLPFAAGLAFVAVRSPGDLLGTAGNRTAFVLVFSCGVAVTSIPVISRIMADLGILGTGFARIVLSVAVIEDFVLYIVLSVAIGLVAPAKGGAFSLAGILSIRPDTGTAAAYYVVASLAFFSLPLALGRSFVGRIGALRGNVLGRSNALAFQVVFMMVLTSVALFLGISPVFGAFIAGILAGSVTGGAARARETIETFSFGFFIPMYFALIGLQLDLVHQLDIWFFLLFLAYAAIVKGLSVYAGARIAGQEHMGAVNLSVALSARGGPAIVLASTAFAAHIISARFFVDLIMLALVTSMAAGAWLAVAVRRGTLLAAEEVSNEVAQLPQALAG
jgi:Kef-type K+ transport system membrane component KefB